MNQGVLSDGVEFWDMWFVQDLVSDGVELWVVEFFVVVDDNDEPRDELSF